MSWFKRASSRKAKLPFPEHPVYGLRVGMNKAAVVERLGPPPASMTDKELSANYDVTVTIGPKQQKKKEWLLYEDVPSAGHDIRVVIASGELESAEVVDTREHRVIWSLK